MPRTHLRWDPNSSPVIPGSPPAAPGWVTSIALDASATVSWDTSKGGGPVQSYVITPYIAGTPQAATTVTGPASSATVTGLANSTAYTFQVQAVNQAGTALSPMSGANTPLANLIFGDDFNGTVLDPAWAVHNRDGDQSNSEDQYYVPANVALDGAGNLVITARNVPYTAPTYNDSNPPTYAGVLVTRTYQTGMVQWNTFSFTYGQVQVRAQVPSLGAGSGGSSGGWPAIWMLGANCEASNQLDPNNVGTCSWPNPGSEEIDIAEFQDGVTANYNGMLQFTAGNSGPTNIAVSSASTTFHTYEADWAAGTLSWKLDGATVGNSPWTTSVPSNPMFLILQSALRGTIVTPFAQPLMTVDWVRVFHN